MKVKAQLRAYDALAAHLRAAREEQEVTQTVLAQRLGRPQSYVAKYERGERQLDLIEYLLITNALGIDDWVIARRVKQVLARPGKALR